jgi:hypothetical protein
LRIITDKNGKWMWTNYNRDGKPASGTGTGGGKGWEMDTTIPYDKEGRKKSTKTTIRRGRTTTVTTRKFDPENGEMTDERSRTFIDGLH